METARIEGILAREANVAVVLRRGPGPWTQCLRWDLNSDEITAGQWIKGRLYSQRADLSPDGELLVAAFTNYSRGWAKAREERGSEAHDSWTAVSRVPYFTALSFWERMGTYDGGGVWLDQRRLALSTALRLSPTEKHGPLKLEPLDPVRTDVEVVFSLRLQLSGWTRIQTLELSEPEGPQWDRVGPRYDTVREELWIKPIGDGALVRRLRYEEEIWELRDEAGVVYRAFKPVSRGAPLLDVDHRGRVIYGDAGCLWAWSDFPNGEPTLVADLNPNRFESLAAPDWAREWPSSAPPER